MRALLCALLTVVVSATVVPQSIVLSAPFTPFNDDASRSLNLGAVAALAAHSKNYGVNTIFAGGSMGQFSSMTVAERMALCREWVKQGHIQGLYVICHCGGTIQSDSIALAGDAKSAGADAIGMLPPYYESYGNWADIIAWFQPVVAAANGLPLYYYHLPGMTNVNLPIVDLLTQAQTALPALAGVKYVSENWGDWIACERQFGSQYHLLFAPEPKLRAMPFGGYRGVVLAESFFAPTWHRMEALFKQGRMAEAADEQAWKLAVLSVFGVYGGNAERAVFKPLIGVDLGPGRWPGGKLDDASLAAMVADLNKLNFFNQTIPASVQQLKAEL